MDKIIGFIGTGNMGQAMIGGMIKSGAFGTMKIMVNDLDKQKLDSIRENPEIEIAENLEILVRRSDIIVLAVKPNAYDDVMESIKGYITDKKVIVTIAAGKSIASMESILGSQTKVVRSMPNTPALVGEGMSVLCCNKNVSQLELNDVKLIFESFGKVEILEESAIDVVIGISGSSPAYVFMFIEAMADAAVLHGMSRVTAYKLASQAVLGSAKMVLETGKHPGELKDMVCSPGGTTIEAVAELEKLGLRNSIIKGVTRAIEKSVQMNKIL